jgi:hypothetical protein
MDNMIDVRELEIQRNMTKYDADNETDSDNDYE